MLSKALAALSAAALFFGVVVFVVFVHALKRSEVLPSYAWHVTGRVLDTASNPLAGVGVNLLTTPKVTGLDRLSEHSAQAIRLTATSDESGRFAVDFSAAFFQVSFTKPGFTSQDLVFGPYVNGAPNTNPVLQVCLGRAPK